MTGRWSLPFVPEAHNNRGNVLNDLKRYDEALVNFDRAIALNPNYAQANVNMGLLLLLLGNYADGCHCMNGDGKLLHINTPLAVSPSHCGWGNVNCGKNYPLIFRTGIWRCDSICALCANGNKSWR